MNSWIKYLILLVVVLSTQACVKSDKNSHVNPEINHYVEGMLLSKNAVTKMNVLMTVYYDSEEWGRGIKDLILRETNILARVHYLEFYWKRKKLRDDEFIIKTIDDILREDPSQLSQYEDYGAWDKMLEWRKNQHK